MKILASTLLLLVGACGDDIDNTKIDATPSLTLNFNALVGNDAAICNKNFVLGSSSSTAQFMDIRFYVSNITLLTDDGEVPFTIDTRAPWQNEHTALLDFEDATGLCADDGTTATNAVITGTAATTQFTGVRFDVGVPFEVNHDDLATLTAPLDVSKMFWNWGLGHKFAKIDVQVDGGDRWNFHLGSIGCDPGPGQTPPTQPCAKPNVATIELNAVQGASQITLDLAPLFADSDLTTNAGSAAGCQSFPPDEPDCTPLFPNIGLDYATGACDNDCSGQSVFTIQ